MGDKIKRRSSIRRINTEDKDANIASIMSIRQKRISFSGRKSVREFHKEEEPKTWNNSYEISDPTSAVEGSISNYRANCSVVDSATTYKTPLAHTLSVLQPIEANISSNSALCTTMEFIDKSQKNGVIKLEHTLDITLLENEHVLGKLPLVPKSMQKYDHSHAALSCGAIDGEAAANNNAAPALLTNGTGNGSNIEMIDWRQQTFHFHEDKSTICKGNMKEKTKLCSSVQVGQRSQRLTTFMDETIKPDCEGTADAKGLQRRTMKLPQDMDVSSEDDVECQQNDENIQPSQSQMVACSMKFDSPCRLNARQGSIDMEVDDVKRHSVLASWENNVKLAEVSRNQDAMKLSLRDTDETAGVHFPNCGTDRAAASSVAVAVDCDASIHMDIELQNRSKTSPPRDSAKEANKQFQIVVRKLCTPSVIPDTADLATLKMRRLQRFKSQSEEPNVAQNKPSVPPPVVAISPKADCGAGLLSPVFDSPVFPPEFVGSQRRRNGETCSTTKVHGASATPIIQGRKPVPLVGKSEASPKPNNQDLITTPAKAKTATAMPTHANRTLIFSELDDMLLDNTIFLTHAKLGDETASQNNSKCSNSNRRDLAHFNHQLKTSTSSTTLLAKSVFDEQQQTLHENKTTDDAAIQNDFACTNTNLQPTAQHDPESRPAQVEPCDISNDEKRQAELTAELIIDETNAHLSELNCDKAETRRRQTLYFNSGIAIDDELTTGVDDLPPTSSKFRNRNTQLFIKGNDMTLESICDDRIVCASSLPPNPIHAAKAMPKEEALEDSLYLNLEKTRASMYRANISEKPKTVSCDEFNNQQYESPLEKVSSVVVPTTPHRSIIEFECLERAATREQQQFERAMATDIEIDISGLQPLDIAQNEYIGLEPQSCATEDVVGTKRMHSNMTPNRPQPKKRATLVFTDYDMDETLNDWKQFQSKRQQTVLFTKDATIEVEGPNNADPIDDSSPVRRPYESASREPKNDTCVAMEMTALNETTFSSPPLEETKVCPAVPPARLSRSPLLISSATPNRSISACTSPKTWNNSALHETTFSCPPLEETKLCPAVSPARQSRTPLLISSVTRNQSISACTSPKTWNNSTINHSLQPIEVARRAITGSERKGSVLPLPIDVDIVENSVHEAAKKMEATVLELEDNPITISDVSMHFLAHRRNAKLASEHAKHQHVDDEPPNNSPALENFRKDFINLTRDTSFLHIADEDDIEKTRLSLVDIVLDEEDDNSNVRVDQSLNEVAVSEIRVSCATETDRDVVGSIDRAEQQRNQVEVAEMLEDCATLIDFPVHRGTNTSMCRKCKRCQETILEETANSISPADSFVLPTGSGVPELGLQRMIQLRQRPNIGDAAEHWRRRSLERSSYLANFLTDPAELERRTDMAIDEDAKNIIMEFQKSEEKATAAQFTAAKHLPRQTFVHSLKEMLQNADHMKANWIFNYQMQYINLLRFVHRQIATIYIDVLYEEKDPFGWEIVVQKVKLQSSRYPKKNWKPIDFLLDFQVRLELPFNLKSLCVRSDARGVFEMLEKIDRIIVNVSQIGRSLWLLVCSEQASLIRESNRTFVRKIVRHIRESPPFPRVEKSEFRIELTNAKKVCFKDIAFPPLHNFHEHIQSLPVGLDFLRDFLHRPTEYLKSFDPDSVS